MVLINKQHFAPKYLQHFLFLSNCICTKQKIFVQNIAVKLHESTNPEKNNHHQTLGLHWHTGGS